MSIAQLEEIKEAIAQLSDEEAEELHDWWDEKWQAKLQIENAKWDASLKSPKSKEWLKMKREQVRANRIAGLTDDRAWGDEDE